jgi:hypothetical protein
MSVVGIYLRVSRLLRLIKIRDLFSFTTSPRITLSPRGRR